MKPRFGITTFVQVVLSLVVLVLVGKLVDTSSGKDDKKGGHSDEPATEAAKPAPTPAPAPTPKTQPTKDGKPQTTPPVGAGDAMKPVAPSPAQKEKMEQRLKMLADMKKHGGTGNRPNPSQSPDGMDPALWQDRDMGQVAPKVEEKKQ